MGRHCDVCHMVDPLHREGLEEAVHLALGKETASMTFGLVVAPNHQRHIVPPGTYVLTVQVAAENCQPAMHEVKIVFDGHWIGDQKEMLEKHVHIDVRPRGTGARAV